jgi:hypothetical protein
MSLAHLTQHEVPFLMLLLAAGAGAGVVIGLQLAVRAVLRRRR